MRAVADERVGARVDRLVRERRQEIGRRLAPVAGLVRVNRDDDEVRDLLGGADALEDLALVDRIHRVGEAAVIRRSVADAEQIDFVGRLFFRRPHGSRRLLLPNLAERLQLVGRDKRVARRPQRVDAGAAGRLPGRGRGTRERRERGRHRDERDASFVRVEIARGARGGAVLADARVDDARFVERAARLPHPLEAPVGRVVVRAGHDVEADGLEIGGDRRRADDPDAAELRLRHCGRAREIDRGPLEVPEGGVGVADDLADGREARRLRNRPRDDVVADGGQREAVGDAHRQLALRVARRRRLLRLLLRRDGGGADRYEQSKHSSAAHAASRAER